MYQPAQKIFNFFISTWERRDRDWDWTASQPRAFHAGKGETYFNESNPDCSMCERGDKGWEEGMMKSIIIG